MFPACSSEAIDLLAGMLAFNPAKRISVDAALRHPFLTAQFTEEHFAAAHCRTPMSLARETIGEDSSHLLDNVSVYLTILTVKMWQRYGIITGL